MMNRKIYAKKNQANRKARDDSEKKPAHQKMTYWQDMNIFLNFSFSEHWIGLTVVAVAICCFFIYLGTIGMNPLWWACIGTILLLDLFIFALFAVTIKRSQPIPVPASQPTTSASLKSTPTISLSPAPLPATDLHRLLQQPAPMKLADGREVVRFPIGELVGYYDGRLMAIQVQKLIAPFLGKWVRVSGQLEDITTHNTHISMTFASAQQPPKYILIMRFKPEQKDRLEILTRGEQITVLGNLTELSARWVWLDHCEIA